MKVFVLDPLWPGLITPENRELLYKADAEIILTTAEAPLSDKNELFSDTSDKILAVNPDYVGWSLPADKFKDIKNLKCIITESTSYGWIDTNFASKHDIAVINIRNFSTDAVAEYAILMMLNVARRLPLLIKNGFPLNFGSDFKTYQGINLKAKRVGIIGLGNIGSAIAQRCEGLGLNVAYWSKSNKKVPYQAIDLKDLFKSCDIIFPCMADNDDTHGIITDDMILSMKPDAMFISVVHKYYNHDLILKRVEEEKLLGYAFEADPATFSNYTGNIWAVPAYAWCTDGSMRKSMDLFVHSIADAVKGIYSNRVN